MKSFKPGTQVPVSIQLRNAENEALVPTSLRWRVLDEAEAVLLDWQAVPLPDPVQDDIALTIPAIVNILTAPAPTGLRTVELEVTTDAGTFNLSETILLQGSTQLVFGINTFQTYTQALLAATEFVPAKIEGWDMQVERAPREQALVQAYRNILALPVSMRFEDKQSLMQVDAQFSSLYGPIMLRDLTPAQMGSLYAPMLKDLQRAQLLEASHLLHTDESLAARESGVLSMTVGESSQFFRTSKPLDLGVCSAALQALQRWVRFTARIGRA